MPIFRALLALIMLSTATLGSIANAAGTVVVMNDRGGYIGKRAREIANIGATGGDVEIRGDVCYSSCTMYLGAQSVCILPQTTFGFHGPSQQGLPLPQDAFDHWSNVMAAHYNAPLRTWFMQEARHYRIRFMHITGAQLIQLGYKAC